MKTYYQGLEDEAVINFGKKLGLKFFYVKKDMEGWHLNFYEAAKRHDALLITDFMVQSRLGDEFNNAATAAWQKVMYSFFGKAYLKDLKKFELARLKLRQGIERHTLASNIDHIADAGQER